MIPAVRLLSLGLLILALASCGRREEPEIEGPELGRYDASIYGLLVIPLGPDSFAGGASKMTAVAVPRGGNYDTRISFNQSVGQDMNTALDEVEKFMRLRHRSEGGIPRGHRIEIGFHNKYSDKDGPSAALACALMLNSLITGDALDPQVAVTGDLNADGSVQIVGGIAGKLAGANRGTAEILMVPRANASNLTDVALLEGIEGVASIQAFTVDTFDQAWEIAQAEKSDQLKEAMELFGTVQDVLEKNAGNETAMLRNAKVQERLQQVIELANNHGSARLLLAWGQDRFPQHLSLGTSFLQIEQALLPATKARRMSDFHSYGGLDQTKTEKASVNLAKIRNLLHPKAQRSCYAWMDFLRAMDRYVNNPDRNANVVAQRRLEMEKTWKRVLEETEALSSDPEVVAELAHMDG